MQKRSSVFWYGCGSQQIKCLQKKHACRTNSEIYCHTAAFFGEGQHWNFLMDHFKTWCFAGTMEVHKVPNPRFTFHHRLAHVSLGKCCSYLGRLIFAWISIICKPGFYWKHWLPPSKQPCLGLWLEFVWDFSVSVGNWWQNVQIIRHRQAKWWRKISSIRCENCPYSAWPTTWNVKLTSVQWNKSQICGLLRTFNPKSYLNSAWNKNIPLEKKGPVSFFCC